MLEKKELLKLSPEERDVLFLRSLWPFLFRAEKFSISLIAKKTSHSEEFIQLTLRKIHKMNRLKLELADINIQIKKILDSFYFQ
jgi:hypothetical protein